MDSEEFGEAANKVCNFIINYIKSLTTKPIVPKVGGSFIWKGCYDKLREITEEGEPFKDVFAYFENLIIKTMVHWNHQRNYSIIPSPNTYACILADMLSANMGGVGFSWKSCPALTELEFLMCDWYAQLLKLPSQFLNLDTNHKGGGCFQQSSSDVMHNIIVVARYRAYKKLKIRFQTNDKYPLLAKLSVYATKESSFSVKRFCEMEGLHYREVPTDINGAMVVPELTKLIQKDLSEEKFPMLVVATITGLTKFSFDNITQIYEAIKNTKTAWLHADAAFGGCSLMLDQYEYLRTGLEFANSICICPHKWSQVSLDCPILWHKDMHMYRKVFVVDAAYLQSGKNTEVDLRHYGIALSRRFRALKVWFTFKKYGTDELKKILQNQISMARYCAKLIKEKNDFDLVTSEFTFVNFRVKRRSDDFQRAVYNKLKIDQQLLLHLIKVDGSLCLRLTVLNPEINEKDIDTAVRLVRVAMRDLWKS